MAEPFAIKKAVELSGVTIFKALKMGMIFLCICGIVGAIYLAYIKPHYNPIKTQEQKAETIQNITHNYPDDNFFIGIKLFGVRLGISK